MGSDWRTFKVSEFADVIGGGTPKTKVAEYWNGSIPWLTPKDLSNHSERYISKGERNISKKGLSNSSARLLPPKTVLLTSRAPVGYLAIAKNELTTNQGFRSLLVKDGFSPEFIYYLLFNNVDYLKRHASGSTFQELSGGTLKELEFEIPEKISEQRAIAHILGSLDDKIELNRQMNQTLEAIGQAIFEHWFVHFEFPDENGQPYKSSGGEMMDSELGEIPVGWEVGTLADICKLNANSWTPKTMPDEIHYVDLANTKNGVISDVQIFDAEEAPSRAKRILLPGDTIFGTVRPGNRSFTLIGDQKIQLTGSTGFAVLTPNDPKLRELVYLITTSEENIGRLTHLADGAAYPAVRPNIVTNEICFLASDTVNDAFHKVVRPLFDHILINRNENLTLSKIRDSLLPKLMSGKIRVSCC